MSQSHLPDDVQRWPKDPYALLDVPQSVDKLSARRAYTRLIRNFKPERFPEQFRLIREAYEALVEQIDWREMFGRSGADINSADIVEQPASGEAPPAEMASADETSSDAPPQSTAPPRPLGLSGEERAAQQLADELDALWERSCDGEHAAVYARLVELASAHPGHDGIVVRLYWLLYADPELDAKRTPTGWLVYGLRTKGLRGPLLELYRRAILATPIEATRERCSRLVQLPDAEPRALAALCDFRWLSAAQLNEWPLIVGDMTALGERYRHVDETLWAGLLLSAIDQLAWAPRAAYGVQLEKYCQELESMHHVQSTFSHALDRLDCLLQIAIGWHALSKERGISEQLLQVVPLSWRGPDAAAQAAGRLLVEQFAANPEASLRLLDRLWATSPAVVAQLGSLIARQRNYDGEQAPPERDEQMLMALVRTFFLEHLSEAYASLRPKLLSFCIGEALPSEQVAALLSNMPDLRFRQNQDQAQLLHDDGPLQYAYLAHEVFWS